MNPYFQIPLVVMFVFQAAPMAFGQQPAVPATAHKYATMNDALSALKQAQDDNSKGQAIVGMQGLPLDTPAQFLTLYDFAAGLEGKITSANAQLYSNFNGAICGILDSANDPRFAAAIAAALDKEFASMPPHFVGAYGAQTGDQHFRFQMRELRLKTLARAAGRTKDRQALPVLRRMLDDNGISRNLASAAIGQIGDPADLDDLINRIKKDPAAQINVGAFGPAAFDRIMKEVNDPAVSPEVKARLQINLREMGTAANKEKYIKLLDHPNIVVRREAATAICRGAKPGDEDVIIKIAHSPLGSTRLDSVGAMGAIWTDKFLPTAIDILLHDDDPIVRGAMAHILAERKVTAAIPTLKKISNDKNIHVRKGAQAALKLIGE